MQRWFWLVDKVECDDEKCKKIPPRVSKPPPTKKPSLCSLNQYSWTFNVCVKRLLHANEHMAVVGSCKKLGAWDFNKAVLMTKLQGCNWTLTVKLPNDVNTKYRYAIMAVDPSNDRRIVRFWETHMPARIVKAIEEKTANEENKEQQEQKEQESKEQKEQESKEQKDNVDEAEKAEKAEAVNDVEVFGLVNGVEKVDRGWITTETIVQFKFFKAPFEFHFSDRPNPTLMVKITPCKQKLAAPCEPLIKRKESDLVIASDINYPCEKPKSVTAADLSTTFAFNEVASLYKNDPTITAQPYYGTLCDLDDLLIFHLTLGDFENTVFVVNFYNYLRKPFKGEPPYHFGYCNIMPCDIDKSAGKLELPILCATTHRPLCQLTTEYLIVKPMPVPCRKMSLSYTRYWNPKWTGLEVGHRGLGNSFIANDKVIRENTISSIRNARVFGADMVEFDVQLTKDLKPVVYHDFQVYVATRKQKPDANNDQDFVTLPLSEFTHEQLQDLKVMETTQPRFCRRHCDDEKLDVDYCPFPLLEELLDVIDVSLGFNIEIKWPQLQVDGSMEERYLPTVDRNIFVNAILEVIFSKARNRLIVLSCFDADTCTMLRYKQKQYPVLFILDPGYYVDPRGHTIEIGIYNCIAMELLGIVPKLDEFTINKANMNLLKSHNLVAFVWGDITEKEKLMSLKKLGLNAIIYDRMHMMCEKQKRGERLFMLHVTDCFNDPIIRKAERYEDQFKLPPPKPKRKPKPKSKKKKKDCTCCPTATGIKKNKK